MHCRLVGLIICQQLYIGNVHTGWYRVMRKRRTLYTVTNTTNVLTLQSRCCGKSRSCKDPRCEGCRGRKRSEVPTGPGTMLLSDTVSPTPNVVPRQAPLLACMCLPKYRVLSSIPDKPNQATGLCVGRVLLDSVRQLYTASVTQLCNSPPK
jgi:hypothetical protein